MDKSGNKSEDEDDFNINEWKATKRKIQEQQSLPQKRTQNVIENGKKTIKHKQDPLMDNLIRTILRQSDKFPDEVSKDPEEDEMQIQQFRSQVVSGIIQNPHQCSAQEKQSYGLGDQGWCMQFDINQKLRVVVMGKLGYIPAQNLPVNLFLPKNIASYLQLKEKDRKKAVIPNRMIRTPQKIIVLIKRRIDQSKNILDYAYYVVDPLNLIYPTYLCSWIDCKRRLALISYIQEGKQVNQHTVYGSTCHRLLQWFAGQKYTIQDYDENAQQIAQKLYNSMLYDMYLVKKSFKQFWQVCRQRLNNTARFYRKYIVNHEELAVDPYKKLYLKVTEVVQSEIMLRSSTFGLKGKIDLLLKGQLIDRQNNTVTPVYIPMELKTGKRVSDSHKRQTDIYNILVRSNFNENTIGLLYYSDSDIKFFRHQDPLCVFEIVLVNRNKIAEDLYNMFYYEEAPALPTFPQSFPQCKFCEIYQSCELSFRHLEKNNTENQVPSKYYQKIKECIEGYNTVQTDYLSRWLKLLHMEERQFVKDQSSLLKIGISKFTVPSESLAALLVSDESQKIRINLIHQCQNQEDLGKFQDYYKPSLKLRCLISQLSLIQNCKIVEVQGLPSKMEFRLVIELNNLAFKVNSKKLKHFVQMGLKSTLLFETFQNSFYQGLRKTIFNLIRSKHFVKDLVLCNVNEEKTQQIIQQKSSFLTDLKHNFNQDQYQAFKMAISVQKYCLIEGMPGTGKTELIIKLIQYFISKHQRILITTFTNKALDNILQRLQSRNIIPQQLLIRQGSQYSTSTNLKHYTSQSQQFQNTQDYQNYYGNKLAWFVTLSSLSIHHLPSQYDVIILDQASQCLQPSCVEALLKGKKFILIGDYLQLQPLVRSKKASKEGMGVSFFERMCYEHPDKVTSLRQQYRMNKQIMSLSNTLVYQGRLKQASQTVGNRILQLTDKWRTIVMNSFHEIIQPSNKVVFINYDPIINSLSKKYAEKELAVRKVIETELPAFLANIFKTLQFQAPSIAIIAALNISVDRISELLCSQKYRQNSVMTIDRSQGIDKQVVILVIQKSCKKLVENPRRLNVALTRAKGKLIVIGSETHLQNMTIWNGTLAKMFKPYQIELKKAMIQDMIKGVTLQGDQ